MISGVRLALFDRSPCNPPRLSSIIPSIAFWFLQINSQYKFDASFYGETDEAANSPLAGDTINNELLLQMVTEQLKRPEFLETVLKAMQVQNAWLQTMRTAQTIHGFKSM